LGVNSALGQLFKAQLFKDQAPSKLNRALAQFFQAQSRQGSTAPWLNFL
jgi:hypothetical protein